MGKFGPDPPLVFLENIVQHIIDPIVLMRAHDKIHRAVFFENVLPFRLGDTAGYDNPLLTGQTSDIGKNLLLRFFTNRATIQHHKIGVFIIVAGEKAFLFKNVPHLLRIAHIHLTTKGFNIKFHLSLHSPYFLDNPDDRDIILTKIQCYCK